MNAIPFVGVSRWLLIVENKNQFIYQKNSVASFSVTDAAGRERGFMGREPGVVQPSLAWNSERLGE